MINLWWKISSYFSLFQNFVFLHFTTVDVCFVIYDCKPKLGSRSFHSNDGALGSNQCADHCRLLTVSSLRAPLYPPAPYCRDIRGLYLGPHDTERRQSRGQLCSLPSKLVGAHSLFGSFFFIIFDAFSR